MDFSIIGAGLKAIIATVTRTVSGAASAFHAFTPNTTVEHFEERVVSLKSEIEAEAAKTMKKAATLWTAVDNIIGRAEAHGHHADRLSDLASTIGQ